MSTNYKETQITGVGWKRSFRVEIDNPYGGIPRVVFHEENCYSIDGTFIKQNAGSVAVEFDASAQIPLINPWTGEPLTNVDNVQQYGSHIEAYIILHSLYIQSALARDNPPAQPEEPETPPE